MVYLISSQAYSQPQFLIGLIKLINEIIPCLIIATKLILCTQIYSTHKNVSKKNCNYLKNYLRTLERLFLKKILVCTMARQVLIIIDNTRVNIILSIGLSVVISDSLKFSNILVKYLVSSFIVTNVVYLGLKYVLHSIILK